MKKVLLLVMFSCLLITFAEAKELSLKNDKDKASYSVGQQIGSSISKQPLRKELNINIFVESLRNAISGEPSQLSEKEMKEILDKLKTKMAQKSMEKRKIVGEKNKAEGIAFLEKNKMEKDVKTTASGLQYRVIEEGDGKSPTLSDTVETHYKGTLIDGTEFDSSYKRNQTATFPVSGVIRGWVEALQLMKTGSKWELFIPSGLAYGERGSGSTIGPDATLIFTVELISIK